MPYKTNKIEKADKKHAANEEEIEEEEDKKCKTKKDRQDTENSYRIDWVDTPFPEENEIYKKPYIDENGFMHFRSVVTNVGVFSYYDSEGNEIRELRPPEEVFSLDSLESLKMLPFTNEHPGGLVTTESIKEVQVGNLGEDWRIDQYHVSMPIVVQDKKTIQDIKNGKLALSCGYKAQREYKSGVWMGARYDYIQRNIRYNHVALVDQGRAGDNAVIKMDGVDYLVSSIDIQDNKKKEDGNMPENNNVVLKEMVLDGVKYNAEAEVVKSHTKLDALVKEQNEKLDSMKKELETVKGERDSFKDQAEKLQKEAESKIDASDVEKLIKQKISVFDKAKEMKIEEVQISDSVEEIMKKVILSISPEAKLDDVSSEYLQARYDAAVEFAIKKDDATNNIQTAKKNDGEKTDSVEAARARYEDSIRNAWRPKEDKE